MKIMHIVAVLYLRMAATTSSSCSLVPPGQVMMYRKPSAAEAMALILALEVEEIMEIKGLAPGPQIKKCQDYLMALAFNNPLMTRDEAVKFLKGFRL